MDKVGGTAAACQQGVEAPLPFCRTISTLFIESNELSSSLKKKKKGKEKKRVGEGKKERKKKNIKVAERSDWKPSLHPSQNCVRLVFLAIMGKNLRIFILQS